MTTHYDDSNIFAKILRGELPCHRVYEDDQTLAFMDIMPVAVGHVLVVPKYPAVELSDLPLQYAQAVIATAQKVMKAQRQVLQTQGITQVQINHPEAGQSVLHYHMHLVPAHFSDIAKHEAKHESVSANPDELAQLAAQLSEAIN